MMHADHVVCVCVCVCVCTYRTYFTLPENLIAGAPARVFFNRKRSWAFADKPNCKIHYGWNGWSDKVLENGAARADFK